MPDSLLLKFQKLPDAAKASASDPAAMRMLDTLEKDYSVNLAELVMRVMVQEVDPAKLDEVLELQYKVPAGKGKELAKHMLDDLFFKFHLLDVPDVKDVLTAEVPKMPLQPQAGASQYLVHPDDHQDIAQHAAALQSAPPPLVDTNPEQVTAKFIQLEKLTLDDMQRKRLQKIVEARLVDVRDKRETTDMLQRSLKIGGMGFDEARASRIVNELEKIVEELHRRPRPATPKAQPMAGGPKVVVKSTPPPAMPAPLPDQGASDGSHPPSAPPTGGRESVQKPVIAVKAATAPVAPKPSVAPPPWLRPMQAPAAMVRPASTPVARPAAPRPAAMTARPEPSYREMVTDVRAPSRVMGPVEVLGNLSLDDFRRLGDSAGARIGKIAEEMDALTRDSFAQRAAGIAAFRQSPTFKAYNRKTVIGNSFSNDRTNNRVQSWTIAATR